jgi:hypothetical protein
MLTTHPFLVQRLRKSSSCTSSPSKRLSWRVAGQLYFTAATTNMSFAVDGCGECIMGSHASLRFSSPEQLSEFWWNLVWDEYQHLVTNLSHCLSLLLALDYSVPCLNKSKLHLHKHSKSCLSYKTVDFRYATCILRSSKTRSWNVFHVGCMLNEIQSSVVLLLIAAWPVVSAAPSLLISCVDIICCRSHTNIRLERYAES